MLNAIGTVFMPPPPPPPHLLKIGLAFNVINLANTYHALGYSAYLLLDVLWFFRWPLRATEMMLNVRVSN